MTRKLEVVGQAQVVDALEEVARKVDDLTETHRRVVDRLVPEVRAGTPRRTGELAVNWTTGADKHAGSILNPLPYAGPIEFGVPGRFAGFHMVGDVLSSSTDDIVREYEDAIAEAGKRAGFEVSR